MADNPLASLAGPASDISPLLGLFAGIMQGQGQESSDDFQAAQLAQKAQLGQIAATEENAQLTTRLNQTLGKIDAVRAASGDSMTSPTGAALRSTAEMYGNEERAIQVGNILEQSDMDTAGANYMQQAGSFAMEMGIFSGITTAVGDVAKIATAGA